jgi:lipid II:glycine glycyltransferase (peptidoglycan interpeptide bridge formation enzyme)
MKAVFKYRLEDSEIENIRKFCNSVDYCSVEQSIGWTQIFYQSKICYFSLQDESGIRSFSQITERLRSAQINYGPVCCEKQLMIDSVNAIIDYYKKLGFYYLGIQMYYKSGYDTEYIEYALNKQHNIKYFFNSENAKSSIEIDLQESIDEIYRKIRHGHKNDIKKAIKLGVTFDVVKDKSDLDAFFVIYSKMCKARKIDRGGLTKKNIHEIYDYLTKYNKGQILISKDKDNVVLGGEILFYQGITVRCWKGVSDPDKRNIPSSHLLLYEAVKRAKNDNFKYFDFGGYNNFADENNTVYFINRFKKGFGGEYTFFAKKMNISLIPYGYNIYRFLNLFKRAFRKLYFKTPRRNASIVIQPQIESKS